VIDPAKPVLVTGATGFVGSAVARALLKQGRKVRVLVRPTSGTANLDKLAVERRNGTLEDAASLTAALAGCAALFHVAADYRLWVPRPETMYRANVAGTRALMQAALDQGVERIVYTSSVAVLGLLPKGEPADEATPSILGDMIGPYKRSKFMAEEIVREMISTRGLPAVSGRMPAFVDTGLNIAHVDDVAAGHLLAEERGRIGERYILGGENLSLREILGRIAAMVGRKPPRLSLPVPALMPVAAAAEAMARVTGKEPFVTRDGLRLARKTMFFTSEKAVSELNYAPRPADDAFRDAVAWFRRAGMLK
jgi:dihydroflavonol-4-reductase